MSTPTTAAKPNPTVPTGNARPRRRPQLVAAGIAAIVLAALVGAWVIQGLNQNVQVLVIGQNVARGETIEVADIATASIASENASSFFSADELDAVAGQVAGVDLLTGTAITAQMLGVPIAEAGAAVTGLSLTPAQMPNLQLVAGDEIVIVQTIPPGAAIPDAFTPTSYDATVFSVAQDATTGNTLVNVTTDRETALEVSAVAGTGNIAIVLVDSAAGN